MEAGRLEIRVVISLVHLNGIKMAINTHIERGMELRAREEDTRRVWYNLSYMQQCKSSTSFNANPALNKTAC